MTRPILFGVNATADPPTMTLCFVEQPRRYFTLRIKGSIKGRDPKFVAMIELRDFSDAAIAQISELAKPADETLFVDNAPVAIALEGAVQERRFAGILHCPACCTKLGRGDSPAIGYIETCHGCKRRLAVRFGDGTVTVILSEPPSS